ncbi:glutamate synthase (NADPH/NADH) small chain [Ruminococcaceae bacterium YRB3002]|nr:glutamate synthase (NADPH/NADH) small chain [Ruminococcaceae bacterium YRB3002]
MSSIKKEAERCLKCKKALCSAHCPISTPIPEVMELFLNGEINKAGELLFINNPLSAVTSIICPHERNCTGHCVLNKKGAPVEFYRIEEYISRFYLETMEIPEIKKNGIKVAVAGAGPAGITMAILLLMKGYEVTLFDAGDNIGGVLRYGIPPFRLPKDLLDMYKDVMLRMGVHFRPNTRIGANILIEDLFPDGYKAVFVSTGTGRPNKLGLVGETLGHVHFAVDYLKSPKAFSLGQHVAVIGAGNVAIDAARTVIRSGRSKANILHYMGPDDMTANNDEVEMAELDGVEFTHYVQAVRIMDDSVRCVRVKRVENEDGTVEFEEDYNEIIDIPADSVIIAIGQGPGADLRAPGVKLTQRGLFEVNEWGETATPGVFAAGDIVSGPRTVVEAVAFTKKVFARMEEYLNEN